MWERGLKRISTTSYNVILRSLPMWERGLKPVNNEGVLTYNESLPMWERGLKLILNCVSGLSPCRSLCGSVD